MAQNRLNLMISSRCKTKFPIGNEGGVELSDIRRRLKREIQSENFFGKPLVKVWINEDETESGSQTSWEACVKQARESDLFIAMLDGEAGWQVDGSGIGICHAEFEAANSGSPGKVRVISLIGAGGEKSLKTDPDRSFMQAVRNADLLEARNFGTEEELVERAKTMVRELVLQLAHEGAREVGRSGHNTGEALDWSRMNFVDRHAQMRQVALEALAVKDNSIPSDDRVIVKVAGRKTLFRVSAIPAAFTVSSAREMVGQPFLNDHALVKELPSSTGGPVHVVVCQKAVTENQAMALLGFPDATIISGSFGIYVADNVQKIQLCLIANCRDAASTRHGLQRLFEWLHRTREDELLSARANSRAKILKVIAAELR